MGVVLRQSFKASVVSYFGVVLGVVNTLLLATKFLSESQLGLTRSLLDFSLLASSFALMGAPGIADRFFAFFREEGGRHNGFLGFLLTYATAGFGLFVLTFVALRPYYVSLFAAQSPELITYGGYLLPLTAFCMLQALLEAYCRNNQRIAVPAVLREVYLKLANMALILAYGLGLIRFEVYLFGYVMLYGTVCLGLLLYMARQGWLYLRPARRRFSRGMLFDMAQYGLFVILGAIGTGLVTRLDTFMLSGYMGQAEVGIFAVAVLMASLIEIPRKSLTQMTAPLLAQSLQFNDLRRAETLHQKAAINQFVLAMLLFLGIWCNLDDIFSLMAKGESYRRGTWVVLFIALAKLIDIASGLSSEIIGYSKFFRVGTLMVGVLALLTWAFNRWLIPLYGISGAAAATALTLLVYSIIRAVFVWWKFSIVPFTPRTLLVVGLGLLTFLIGWLTPAVGSGPAGAVLTILLRSTFMTLVYAGLAWRLNISEEFNALAAGILRRKK